MKITLVQAEIHDAIEAYIRNQITINDGMQVNITLRATRGDEGSTAEIDIAPIVVEAIQIVEETKPVMTRRPRTPKVEAAPVVANTEVTQEVISADEVAGEVLSEEPEPNSEAALAAEALRTEPATEVAATDEDAPAKPRASLFGGLNKAATKND